MESTIIFPKKFFLASTQPINIPGTNINIVDSIPIFILKRRAFISKSVNLTSV